MRSKSILLLTLALGCGLIASIGISQVMDRTSTPTSAPGEMAPIYVALIDIPGREVITPEMIKLEEWPKAKIPAGAITKLEEIQGKRCRSRVFKDEAILQGKLVGPDDRDIPTTIPRGFRVVSVRVDAVTGASSLILPGDRVDVVVYLRRDASSGVNTTSAKTILQDIKVFAVDTVVETDHGKDERLISAKTVSLLVTPKQAEKVTLATEMGTIRLAMRSPDDPLEAESAGVDPAELFGASEKGDREKEDIDAQKQSAISGLKEWIDKQKQQLTQGQPGDTQGQDAAGSFKMIIHQGSDITEAEISADGHVAMSEASGSGSLPTNLQPVAVAPQDGPLPPTKSGDSPGVSAPSKESAKGDSL